MGARELTTRENMKEKSSVQVAVMIRHEDELVQPLQVPLPYDSHPEEELQDGSEKHHMGQSPEEGEADLPFHVKTLP
jgi:hypothetical protein